MFKKTLQALYKYKFAVLLFIAVGFLLGFFITQFVVNNNFSYYKFEVTTEADLNEYFNNEFFKSQEDKIYDYNSEVKDYNKKLESGEITGDKKATIYLPSGTTLASIGDKIKVEEIDENTYSIKIPSKCFSTTFVTSTMKVSEGITKCEKAMKSLFDSNVEGIEVDAISINSKFVKSNYQNPYLYGSISAAIMLVISIVFFSIASINAKEKFLVDISDNELIFKTPFHKKYWMLSKDCFSKVINLAVMAILFALMMCCKAITLPSGFGALGLSLTYLFFSIIACIYGPLAGLAIGLFSDILGFVLFPDGQTFFIGYTIDAMLAGFTYGIAFYRTKVTFAKCLYARIFVNLIINVIFGSMWWSIINSFTFDAFVTYMLVISLPKNLIYLLPQSILLFIVLKAVMRPLKSFNLIDYRICDNVSII